jgi:hypothetical protein
MATPISLFTRVCVGRNRYRRQGREQAFSSSAVFAKTFTENRAPYSQRQKGSPTVMIHMVGLQTDTSVCAPRIRSGQTANVGKVQPVAAVPRKGPGSPG